MSDTEGEKAAAPAGPCVFVKKSRPNQSRKRAHTGELLVRMLLPLTRIAVPQEDIGDDDDTSVVRRAKEVSGLVSSTKYASIKRL